MVAGGAIHEPGGLVSTVGVDSTFFSTLGVPLVSGQEFTEEDGDWPGSSVVVNDRFARLFFGTRAVIGQQVRVHSPTGVPDTRTIVGVVQLPGADPAVGGPALMFVPRAIGSSTDAILLIRGTVPPDELAALLRGSVKRVDPDVPLSNVLALPEATREASWNARVSQTLISAIASVGLCLAMIGVAALTAHRVATRVRELSIRVALGATPAMLVRAVLGPVMAQLSIGLFGGALLAKGWQRAFGNPIAASDNLAVVVVLVSATTILFSAWPARRAAHVNPIAALHAER
jgi:putative ABC transport system permease protein